LVFGFCPNEVREVLRILLLGAPGAGKGTFAEMIEKDSGVVHLSSGDLLREAGREGTQLGRTARE